MKRLLPVACLCACLACTPVNHREQAKAEIKATEKAFNKMAADSGIAKAFKHFAAPDAVMLRGKQLLSHPDSLTAYLVKSSKQYPNATLSWEPSFVDAAHSGELGYTYGTYSFVASETLPPATGYFHTVWKKQASGEWKFVWD